MKDIDTNRIQIIIADNPTLWIKIREYLGSFTYRQPPGRNMKFFIYQDNWLLGILELSSPVMNLKVRDDYLKLQSSDKGNKLKNIAEMSTCMATQPFGYFYNGGKLIALLGTTVKSEYYTKYGNELLYVTTMGRNKRPTQYDRALKFLGYTKGKTFSHISDEKYAEMMNWLKNNNYQIPSAVFGSGSNARMRRILEYIKKSGDNTIKYEEMERPVYIAETTDKRENIIKKWYEKFAIIRYNKIVKNDNSDLPLLDYLQNEEDSNDT